MTWKELYAQAMTRHGAMCEVMRLGMLAAQRRGIPELAYRLTAERIVPVYLLCATLDTYGVNLTDEASALLQAPTA